MLISEIYPVQDASASIFTIINSLDPTDCVPNVPPLVALRDESKEPSKQPAPSPVWPVANETAKSIHPVVKAADVVGIFNKT